MMNTGITPITTLPLRLPVEGLQPFSESFSRNEIIADSIARAQAKRDRRLAEKAARLAVVRSDDDIERDTNHRQYHLTHLRHYTLNKKTGCDTPTTKGGLTLAFKPERTMKSNGHPAVIFNYGISLCSFNDRYERAYGRKTAMFRLDEYASMDSDILSYQPGIFELGRTEDGFLTDMAYYAYEEGDLITFTGAGAVQTDLPQCNLSDKDELIPSRNLHITVVRIILEHALYSIHKDYGGAEKHFGFARAALDPDQYPALKWDFGQYRSF